MQRHATLNADPLIDDNGAQVVNRNRAQLTFSSVKIDQQAAGWSLLASPASAAKTCRCHKVKLNVDADGSTVAIAYADDAAGANAVVLEGALTFDANGGYVEPFEPDPDGCLAAPAGKHLGIITTAGKAHGYAVVSTD